MSKFLLQVIVSPYRLSVRDPINFGISPCSDRLAMEGASALSAPVNATPVMAEAVSSTGTTAAGVQKQGKTDGGKRDTDRRERAKKSPTLQMLVAQIMNQNAGMIRDWCTTTNRKNNTGRDACMTKLLRELHRESITEGSPFYKSVPPSKEVRSLPHSRMTGRCAMLLRYALRREQ